MVLSYLHWQIRPHKREDTFEEWVTNRFGYRLFSTFFKTYTEKVWSIPCSELSAEWAAQRIKGLALKTVVLTMFVKPGNTIKTLIEEFDYPRLGPGMMWQTVAGEIEEKGGRVRIGGGRRAGVSERQPHRIGRGRPRRPGGNAAGHPLRVEHAGVRADPEAFAPAPAPVREAARQLTYRDFLTVCLIVRKRDLFPDNWIYVHSAQVRVGRIQNFANWSPAMVPDASKSSLGLEYFCTEGDALWNTPNARLIEPELETIGLVTRADIEDGCVFRVPKAYPVYDASYADYMATVREFVDGLENLQTIGRNGLHRYNNQDHAMLTGLLAVRNLVLGERNDLWSVNTEAEYHEEVTEKTLTPALRLALFLATSFLVLKGGAVVGPTLGLLAEYFPSYTVSPSGAALGLLYGFLAGGALGWTFALLRNTMLLLYVAIVRRRVELGLLRRLLEFV